MYQKLISRHLQTKYMKFLRHYLISPIREFFTTLRLWLENRNTDHIFSAFFKILIASLGYYGIRFSCDVVKCITTFLNINSLSTKVYFISLQYCWGKVRLLHLQHSGGKSWFIRPTSGTAVTLKTGRREVPGSNPGRGCRPSRSEFSVVFSETRVNTG